MPIRLLFRLLAKLEHVLDSSEASQSRAGRGVRNVVALMFGVYATVLEATSLYHGEVSTAPLIIVMVAIALFVGRGGRFLHYFVPVFLGIYSYALAGRFVSGLKLAVHYTPQIKAEEWLIPGPLPTLWLQDHLYHGKTGALEVFALAMYLSHFWVPLAVGFGLVLTGRIRPFATLMFGLLTASILAELTFVLAPTAPPWLAAQDGYLPPVHHILKQSLYDLHLTQIANLIGNSDRYDVTAAVPSLHVAFPIICLWVVWRNGLPRWISVALALNTLGVVFAIVYTGDHYFVDAVAGALYAAVAWSLVRWLMGRSSECRSEDEALAARRATASS